jgi:flagellar secretion chaperone FliS
MLATAVNRYKQVVASTSTPGELLLALYSGLFRYLRQARMLIEAKQRGRAAELVSKSRAIIVELELALDHDVYPELCGNLAALYGFCLDRLRVATREDSVQAIDEVIRVLTPLHQAWQLAVPKATREQSRADNGRR